jgi:mevalonate kinase
MGEHAAVYGRSAVVTTVDLRTRVGVSPLGTGGVELDLPDLGHWESCTWEELLAYGNRRRELWRSQCEQPGGDHRDGLGSRDEAGVVKVAVAEAIRVLERTESSRMRPAVRVSVRSDLPVGSGLGSSASVAVAVGAAFLGSVAGGGGFSAADERIAKVALEAEKRQHGQPSGVDHTTVIRGGFLSLIREGNTLRVSDLPRPDWSRQAIQVYDTGGPVETTGEVVVAVRKQRDREPSRFAQRLNKMERSTEALMAGLGGDVPAWPTLLAAVRGFQRCLEELEVVPSPVAEAVRRVEAAGGAAKLSGAGSLSGSAAGCLIVLWPPQSRAEADLDAILGDYRPLDARLGVNGLELTRDSDV